MFRNLFAICTTLVLGAAGASASTPTATPDLEQRIRAAQNTINTLTDVVTDDQASAKGEKVAQYWGNYYRRPRWRDWSNWGNYRRYYY